jgi:hypothetical protein
LKLLFYNVHVTASLYLFLVIELLLPGMAILVRVRSLDWLVILRIKSASFVKDRGGLL